jgi:hypothetical protein
MTEDGLSGAFWARPVRAHGLLALRELLEKNSETASAAQERPIGAPRPERPYVTGTASLTEVYLDAFRSRAIWTDDTRSHAGLLVLTGYAATGPA